ncbi:myelin-oligodendrocyte glycoprotein-like [Rhinichthys klamathensis goyatoka]|uniref:myelin-oligodendrocyte glycoprotein-like n=1 Tax=Rhinichthys klamathensis goyatoka TaxID=3034132 RepID=UPI0024B59BED|nr:myelin-oligodendrocyte glycoprotein-like [Rhinichthys klamathensis goyatoka]
MTLLLMANSESIPHTQHNTYRRCCFIYLLVLLIDTASQHRSAEEGVEGGSVVLRCSHRSFLLEDKQLTVYWRHNDNRNVFDFIHGEVSVEDQHPAYKNRAEVLPEELKNGRISLKLTDLQLSDGGTYICFVPDVGVHHSTQLVVKERPVTEHRAAQVRSHGTDTSLGRSLQLLLLPGFILQFI